MGSPKNSGKARKKSDLEVRCQVAFASGLFQGDLTIRIILESLAEGVIVVNNSGIMLLLNAAAERMFGYQGDELVGRHHSILIPERFRKTTEEHLSDFILAPKNSPMGHLPDLIGLRKDGSEFYLQLGMGFIETINGVLILALVSDITLRKRAEKELHESEALFHLQIERVKEYAIFTLDAHGNIMNWNSGAERLKGYRAEEIIGKHFSCFYSGEERLAGKPEYLLHKAATEGQARDEGWRFRKDGEKFWADVIITALHDEDGSLLGFSKVTHDITIRKQSEEELRRYSQRLIVLEEELRKKIAMELHDDIAQVVVALGFHLEHIRQLLPDEAGDEVPSLLADSSSLTEKIICRVRNLMSNLYPAALDDFGLAEALRLYVNEYANRANIPVSVDIDPKCPRLHPKKEAVLFRITQEALANVAKHAHATKVSISLKCDDGCSHLSINDDGKGFTPPVVSPLQPAPGWGLTIMRERAKLVGGSFRLDTCPGEGTTISIDICEGRRSKHS